MKLKLGERITLGFSILCLMLILMSAFALYNMGMIHSKLDEIVNLNNYKIKLCIELFTSFHEIVDSVKNIALFDNDQQVEEDLQRIAKARELYVGALAALEKIKVDSEQGLSLRKKMNELMAIGKPYNNQIIELRKANKVVEARNFLVNTAVSNHKQVLDTIAAYIDVQEEKNQQDGLKANSEYSISFIFLTISGLLAIIVGIITATIIIRSVTKPVNRIATSINESSSQVAAAANQLSASAQQLSQGSSEQASAIEETSSTLQESTSMLQQNSINTKQAALLSEQAKESANKGSNEMLEMMDSMQELTKSSAQIGKIIKVIDDIAFQTNILALNAAVEAARAGEAGMGFAVVAEEVRNLAGRSAQAAKDTTAIIESNIELAEKGVAVADRVREAFNEISSQVNKVNELVNEISAASQEQAQGVDQVNQAMSQMEKVTQQNATNAEESASASEELSAQADKMRKFVQELSELVNGAKSLLDKNHLNQNRLGYQLNHNSKPSLTNEVGITQHPSFPQNTSGYGLTDKSKTRVLSPEDVIPLENDRDHF